jgi:trans-aconitate methyltransferase
VSSAVLNYGGKDIVDLGAGDGGLIRLLQEDSIRVPMWGYDLQPTNKAGAAERGVDVEIMDFTRDTITWADVVVMAEVLEHLQEPHAMLRRVLETSSARYLIASSPYTETREDHYIYHLWAWDQLGYESMIEAAGWRVISTDTAWISQIVLADRVT